MPTYQYACTECRHTFEQVQAFTDDALTVCPQCQGRLRKVFNAVGVVFKGSGFYRNDSRSPETSGAGDAANGSSEKSGDKSDSKGGDTSDGKGGEKTGEKTGAGSGTSGDASGSATGSSQKSGSSSSSNGSATPSGSAKPSGSSGSAAQPAGA